MASEFVLTKRGKIEMEKKLEYLKTVRRAEISEQIKVARSFGDLSENAEYTEARNEQARVEGTILSIENTLRTATIVDDDEINLETIGIGTKIRLLDLDTQEEEEYQLFGSMEADVSKNCISNESLVGKALIGKSVGDKVEVEAPGGLMQFMVLEISKADKEW